MFVNSCRFQFQVVPRADQTFHFRYLICIIHITRYTLCFSVQLIKVAILCKGYWLHDYFAIDILYITMMKSILMLGN